MKILHLYLTRQVLATLGMTVAVFTFVLLLGNVLKEILALLVNRQATIGVVLEAVALLVPFVLAFALPMGMLTATLLVFGRFSADHELTAVRANGISLISLITPVLLLSVALSGVCAWFNLQLSQQGRSAYKELIMQLGRQKSASLLTAGRFINAFKGYNIYVGKVRGNALEDVLISQDENGQIILRLHASGGQIMAGATNNQMVLHLTNAWSVYYNTNEGKWYPQTESELQIPVDYDQRSQLDKPLNYSDMTFAQLWSEKQRLEKLGFQPAKKEAPEEMRQELSLISQMKGDMLMPVTVQIHRQVAFSFACIGFTLVGIPLGIRAHRRETSVGIGIAILLVLVYYSFFVLAQSLDTRSEMAPHLIMWMPNFIFQAVGAVLLWRANRGV